MGANKSSQKLAMTKEADDLRKERQQLNLEKQRLKQLALQQHWTTLQLQEEQRRKEAVEKWRREQQQNDAYVTLQRQLKELQVQLQQDLYMEQQKKRQQRQVSAPVLTTTREFVDISETDRIQQRVLPNVDNNNKRRGPPPLLLLPESTPPLIDRAEPAISFVDKKVVPKQRKDLPEAKLEAKNAPNNFVTQKSNSTTPIEQRVLPNVDNNNKTRGPRLLPLLPESAPPLIDRAEPAISFVDKKVVPKQRKDLPEAKLEAKNAPNNFVTQKSNSTTPIEQRVLPNVDNNNKRRGPRLLPLQPESAPPLIDRAEPAISFVDKKVVPKQRKDLPEAKLEAKNAPNNFVTQESNSKNFQKIQKPIGSTLQPVVTEKPRNVLKPQISRPSVSVNKKVIPELQKTLPEGESKPKNIPTIYASRIDNNVRYKEWSLIDYVSEENSISKATAENVIKLLESDNNIPFIARYRKSMTQGMEMEELRKIENSFENAKMIKDRAIYVFNDVDRQGKWTPAFHALVQESRSLADLNHVQSIFEISNTSDSRLRNIAAAVIAGENINALSDAVQPAIEGLRNEDQVKDGILCTIADTMNKDKRVFDSIKVLRSKHAIKIETKIAAELYKAPTNENITKKYALYNNFVSSENDLTADQMLNISRGEAEKVLKVKLNIPTEFSQSFKAHCLHLYAVGVNASLLHKELINAAIDYMYHRWTRFFIRNRIRDEIMEKAENAVMEIIVQNIKRLMLASSVGRKVVIGIATSFERICKIAAVSESGDFLEAETINIRHTEDLDNMAKAEKKVIRMIRKYKCTSLAVGDGTACRETVNFLESLIKKNAFRPLKVSYATVDAAGLMSYSCSRAAAAELPGIVESIIAAVSIARRLQDPVAELVKIDPKHLVAKMHQQEVPEEKLTTLLNKVIVDVVSSIGVDINTASVDLLKRVAGLDDEKAFSIIEWRIFSDPFTNRNDLKKVRGIDNKNFEQCAGFVRIIPETAVCINSQRVSPESFNYLDQTSIHPESYDTAEAFVASAGCNINQFGTKAFIFAIKLFAEQGNATLAKKFDTTKDTIDLIVKELTMERRSTIAKAKSDVNLNTITSTSVNPKRKQYFDNLSIETVLTGVVVNIKPYGAFANVGAEKPGLIRRNHMNGMTLAVGQRVETIVHNIDRERRVFGLRLVKCL